ncbi:hypothetical protein HPMBJEAJ_00289 [Aeromonas phage avDM6]|nr:hypothetical protein HPMBJEAJ_00289 [Aeromonas phage avDM6]
MTNEQIELFIDFSKDYGYYLTHMGFEDTPTSLAVYEGYFNSMGGKTTLIMEPNRGKIFSEIKYQINELCRILNYTCIIENNIKSLKLENRSYFKVIKTPLDLKGWGFSHLLVQDGFQDQKYFSEYFYPIIAASRSKVSIIITP